jgi:DNA polymerase III delta prime subunit
MTQVPANGTGGRQAGPSPAELLSVAVSLADRRDAEVLRELAHLKYQDPSVRSLFESFVEEPEHWRAETNQLLARLQADSDKDVIDWATRVLQSAEARGAGVAGRVVGQINAPDGRVLTTGGDVTGTVFMGDVTLAPPQAWAREALSALSRLLSEDDSDRRQRNRKKLINDVWDNWIGGLLEHSVHHAVLLALGKTLRRDIVDHPWDTILRVHDEPPRMLAPTQSIEQVFRDLNQALLILGEPGSGKTITLLELARDMLLQARSNPRAAVPVVLNLSSWQEGALANWLMSELQLKYGMPHSVSRAWLDDDQLLLLLDGLDEVAAARRLSCIQAINEFRRDRNATPIAVCSRTQEYEELRTRLQVKGAVLLQPLTRLQIDEYLEAAGAELETARQAFKEDPSLYQLAESPLMLSVIALAYRRASHGELRALERSDQRHRHVFEAYLRQVFRRPGRTPNNRYSDTRTLGWLVFLARNMARGNTSDFLLEQLQPSWLPGTLHKRLFDLLIVAGCLFVFGVPIGLVWAFAGAYVLNWDAVLSALVFVPSTALVAWIAVSRIFGFRGAAIVGITYGAAVGLVSSQVYGPATGFGLGGLTGIASGTGFSLVGVATSVHRPMAMSGERYHIVTFSRLRWSWLRAFRGVFPLGLLFGAVAFVLAHEIIELIVVPVVGKHWFAEGAATGVAATLSVALFTGLVSDEIKTKSVPNQGIWQSAANGATVGLIAAVIAVVPVLGVVGTVLGPESGAAVSIALGAYAGLGGALLFGVSSWVLHFALRAVLWLGGYMPRDYAQFLDYAADLIILRRAGGTYRFIHRALLEHLASAELASSSPDSG